MQPNLILSIFYVSILHLELIYLSTTKLQAWLLSALVLLLKVSGTMLHLEALKIKGQKAFSFSDYFVICSNWLYMTAECILTHRAQTHYFYTQKNLKLFEIENSSPPYCTLIAYFPSFNSQTSGKNCLYHFFTFHLLFYLLKYASASISLSNCFH